MDMMMLKAIADPMLMQCKTQAQRAETSRALIGTSYPGGTRATKRWNGTPLSRANEKSCLEEPAMVVKFPKILRMIKMVVRPEAPPADPLAVKNTWMIG